MPSLVEMSYFQPDVSINPTGDTYEIKDAAARSDIQGIQESVEAIVQESAFSIVVEDNEYVLYWYGAFGECPYTITLENGEYVLNFTYTT